MSEMFRAIFGAIASLFYTVENVALAAERITNDLVVEDDDLDGQKTVAKLQAAHAIKQQIRASRNPKKA